ncbi:LPXTG cell wall anchor domain-containing protein, partial [Acinetobacter baumannii]
PKYVDGQKELPNTGTEANASLAALGLLGALGGFGLLSRKKKED